MTDAHDIPPTEPIIAGRSGARLHRFGHDAMACTFELLLAHPDARYAEQAANAVFDEIDLLESLLSRYRPTSDISQINAAPAGQWVRLSPAAMHCLKLARRMYDLTAGCFDVTVPAELGSPAPGMDMLQISDEYHAVGLRCQPLTVDLGGIGKGYALDHARRVLADWSITDGLIHAAQSTMLSLGTDAVEAWQLPLRDPAGEATLGTACWSKGAISGSGRTLRGEHIREPRSGAAATRHLAAWSYAPTAAEADALSTALLIMDRPTAGHCFEQRPDCGGLIMTGKIHAPELITFGDWPTT